MTVSCFKTFRLWMEFRMQLKHNEDECTLEVNEQHNRKANHIWNQWTESQNQLKMTFSLHAVSATVIVTFLLSDARAFEVPTNSCAIAIHKFLSESSPVFDAKKKSLSLEIGKCFTVSCLSLNLPFKILFILWTILILIQQAS